MDPLFQFLLSTMGGVFVFLFFVAREYLRCLGWLLGSWDRTWGTRPKLSSFRRPIAAPC